jgi:hypothetical protein
MPKPGLFQVRNIVVIAILATLFVVAVYVTQVAFTSTNPGGNDFYSRWVGGCALLRQGANPYSEAVTLRIQLGMYGRPALPDEDKVAFAYPLYSLLFFFPLCATQNYALVQAAWFWLLLAALLTATMLALQLIRWQPPKWLWLLVVLWAVVLYHSFRALLLGQFAVVVLLCLVAALWAMQRGHDGWAGIFLALSTVKPQMVYLAIPWLLIWAAGQRRWRLWIGFGGAMAALVLGAMVLLPSWIPDFVNQVIAYPSYTVYGSLTWLIVRYWLGLGPVAEIVALVALALAALFLAWRLWRGTFEQMLWMLGLLLLLTNFFTPRIATTNYILLLPHVLWALRLMHTHWKRWGTWAIVSLLLTSLIGLWALFLTTIQGNFERAPVYLPWPVVILLLLLLIWRQEVGLEALVLGPRQVQGGAERQR